ncbi:formate dehydrogenase major subunit [Nocardioides scoriae]|uniref:Formate dehydrogenase major subunit n=1 Tax=Nocardioides scoriae TaxID=642780 RepID=A0A1H1LC16_9ACTN|nr:FdhF/YdeP family oxidoreductase [Nocardioides scoriae]SDR71977.1 formate dehydrogenase major subunit [Nocardioides scoriae]
MVLRRKAPMADIDENNLKVGHRKKAAAGVPAVAVSMKRSLEQMGPYRTARTLLKLNQADGFDCQGCAWPDPDPEHRHAAEFCENGAKAVAEEATKRTVSHEFFAENSLADLSGRTDYWLGHQGRLVHPVVKRSGGTHYEPISWEDAFALVGDKLRSLASPDEAIFYTSGKVSNEAAYVYQLFSRTYGTNNLPDCSNMCHESTSVALAETIGIGKGSVSLDDVHHAELIIISGQNPGTNHPRMLSALEIAKQNGAKILAINPLPEAGLFRFDNPQTPRGVSGIGTGLADMFLPIRINGDLALWQGVAAVLLEAEERQGGVLDRDFIESSTVGFDAWAAELKNLDWTEVERATGLTQAQVREAAQMLIDSDATVHCWAMGITQHRNSVGTIKEIVNVSLMQGNIGKPGAGLCPVRGHSNVQGDRTMGIWEKVPDHFLDALAAHHGIDPPREHGLDTVDSIRALRDGKAKVFMGLGGNFVQAAPDTVVTESAMQQAELTVQVSTKLNRSHVTCGDVALILPPLGRSEQDRTGGRDQRVTVEDSMSAVHASRGPLKPAAPTLRSEVDILCSIAEATLGTDGPVPWSSYRADYTEIRRAISVVVPGCAAYDEKVDQPGGFVLPHPPRDTRTFPTEPGKAVFSVVPMSVLQQPEGRLLLQTMRSHDQFNTTIYGLSDRYRGISDGRRVVFLHPDDITESPWQEGDLVDLVSEWEDGTERRASSFRIVSYATPKGCAAAYYPETNPLIPLDSTAEASNTPTSKGIVIRLEPNTAGHDASEGNGDAVGSDEGHKSDVEPEQLS